jgi:hypothetical protein
MAIPPKGEELLFWGAAIAIFCGWHCSLTCGFAATTMLAKNGDPSVSAFPPMCSASKCNAASTILAGLFWTADTRFLAIEHSRLVEIRCRPRISSRPGPVVSDSAQSYVGNFLLTTGNAKPFKIADLTNPILQPWLVEQMRKTNEEVLAGKVGFTARSRCWPHGVPGFLLYPVHPIFFIRTSKQVVMTWGQDFQLRHVYLNVPHSASPKPSWYGESVGHYENGDTLVVDTIGLNDKTYVDNFRTPHTTQLHVVERFKIVNGGEGLEVKVHVEDPGAFTTPWNAVQRYRRDQREQEVPLHEMVCAENNEDHFHQGLVPIPQADKSEF